ncbi:MAG: M1 family metallopeptidase [Steroidobacteraceae bacterium]
MKTIAATHPVYALFALAIPLSLALPAAVLAEAPFSFDTAPGRLPKNVVPEDYRITLVPDAEAMTLAGAESVTLEFREASDTIRFNSLNEKLAKVLLDGKPVKSVVSDDQSQLTTVTLATPAPAGEHTLSFVYTGRIETKPKGLFAQPFVKPGGAKDLLLSTQFEFTDARRMFPCWDEPAFRATYMLTVTVPSKWKVVSNMPAARSVKHGATTTTTFQRSPKMPSYLVEFSAGDLARVVGHAGKVELGVWAVRGQEQYGKAALTNARQILLDYNGYFGMPFPLPKLDSIAIPGGFNGAMENWGAITFNDQYLLVTPASTLDDTQLAFAIQAHEMAHQWNGDLVTMGWWDDLWLNENFASWRAAKETDARHPSWKWWELQDEAKENAMAADAQPDSHAIHQRVTDELQAAAAIDPQITLDKGQAVLRMIEAYLGPDTFRDGIRAYMKSHAYSNATGADLWNALSKTSGRDVGSIASNWIEQPGFPVVSVTASRAADGNRTITLSQQRFLLQGSDTVHPHWSVPLQIRSGAKGTPLSVLLTQDGQTVAAGRWGEPLSVDAGALGFYRVMYDGASLQTNTKAFGTLPDSDRIALLDDEWALVESGAQKLPAYLALAVSMGDDLDERAWNQITHALGKIEYDERGTPGHAAFATYARAVIKPVADRLGWDAKPEENPGIQKLRRTVLGDLGDWGDPQVVAEVRKRFAAFVNDRSAIRPDDQAMILSIVALNADEATFQQLHAIAKSARDESELRRFYLPLMSVRDPGLADEAAQIALSDEIPAQAAALRFQMIGRLTDYHPALGWKTFTNHSDALMKPFGALAPLAIAQYAPPFFWNAAPLDQLEAWIKAHVPSEMAPNVARGMEAARFQVAIKKMLVPAVDAYARAKYGMTARHRGVHCLRIRGAVLRLQDRSGSAASSIAACAAHDRPRS